MTREDAPKGAPEVMRTRPHGSGTVVEDPVNPADEMRPYALPEEFWASRSILRHIRQAAHSRTRSADVVLHAVLARVAGTVNHTVKLPALVGSRAPLCYFAAVVGPPGTGKSSGYAIAAELLPVPVGTDMADGLPIGSGEGLVEALFDVVREKDPITGTPVSVKRQKLFNAMVYVDEGDALAALGSRNGSTTFSTLRSIWSGEVIGQANASADRKRKVPAGQYTYGLVVGLQPTLAGPLLKDAAAGTPQRFGWAWATDPTIPDERPEWPGELDVVLPSAVELARLRPVRSKSGFTAHEMPVANSVTDEIRKRGLATARGDLVLDLHDAHLPLLQLKVAGLLAILDGRLDVKQEDWGLADTITTVSGAVRRHVEDLVRAEAGHQEWMTSNKLANRAVDIDKAVTLNRIDRAAHRICRVVKEAGGEALVSQIRRKCRDYADVFEEAVTYAVDHNWLIEDTEPGQGQDKRILRIVR